MGSNGKNVVSIVIPTLVRDTLYPLIDNLLEQKVNFDYEIVLVPQANLRTNLQSKKQIKIYPEEKGKGFGYYRNVGIKHSQGNIIVFIDDDEMPMNRLWLNTITKPIVDGNEEVVTSGYKIKLNQGYLTDCISLLGFPGGGAIGFKTMWNVDQSNHTSHICTGNLAIKKSLLVRIGNFEEKLKSGNEDVLLGDSIRRIGIPIKYIGDATVYHVARSGYFNFVKWNILRGRSAYQLKLVKKDISENLSYRITSSVSILKKTINTKYFLIVLFMMINQYFWQSIGFAREKINYKNG